MLPEQVIILGAIIQVYGGVAYVIDTVKGRVQPNRVSWFIWALAPMIALWAQLDQGVGIAALLTFMVGFNPLMIFIASFANRKAYWKLGAFDVVCGVLALVGIVLWQLTDSPNLAITFAILADGVASLPTVRKAWAAPETENYKVFMGGTVASALTLLVIDDWSYETYAFSAYILGICALLVLLIRFKLGRRLTRTA